MSMVGPQMYSFESPNGTAQFVYVLMFVLNNTQLNVVEWSQSCRRSLLLNFVAIPPIHFGRQDLLIESQLIS
jgi:hypothetical protein